MSTSMSKRDVVWIFMCVICWVMSLAFAVLMFVGCLDGCDPESTRCYGSQAEVCNSDGSWELAADCSDIEDFGLGLDWVCCADPVDGMHSCLPYEECSGVADGGSVDSGIDGGM